MLKWFKKKTPDVKHQDLLSLIEATPDASPRTHIFIVPSKLANSMKWAIGKPFCICLWWETFEGYSIDCSVPFFGEPENAITLISYRTRKHSIRTTCR